MSAGGPRLDPKLVSIVEDFERLWLVAGFAELFSARLAAPPAPEATAAAGARPGAEAEPAALVLAEHRRQLLVALRRGQRRGEICGDREPAQLADALVGFYLSRRLGRGPLRAWAQEAIGTVLQR